MPDANDRRVLRTQRVLREAFIALLRKKNYDDITVKDILTQADVGRSTFYAHCTGKEDLLRLGLRNLQTELAQHIHSFERSSSGDLTFSLPLLEHVASHRDLYPALGRLRGQDIVQREMRRLVFELVQRDLKSMALDASCPQDFLAYYITGAFMSVLFLQLEQHFAASPAQVDALFQRTVSSGLASYRR